MIDNMGSLPAHWRHMCRTLVLAACFGALSVAQGQTQDGPRDLHAAGQSSQRPPVGTAPPARHGPVRPYGGGSPLNVLLHTKLWETPPKAKTFVKANRKPSRELRFMPTAEPAYKRPKLLSPTQLKALEGDLEQAGARNERAAGVKDHDFATAAALAKAARLKRRRTRHHAADRPIKLH